MNESNDTRSIAGAKRQNRRLILWVACGAYLLYLAFQLGKSLYAGEVPAGTETYVAGGACGVFALVGLALLILSARSALRSFKQSMDAYDEAEAGGDTSSEEDT